MTRTREELTVNLLLNRASPWADIDSYIPYQGHVEIRIKQPCQSIKIRVNRWIEKTKVACQLGKKPATVTWDGDYLLLGGAQPGQTLTLEFPIAERTEMVKSYHHQYRVTLRGNDVVKLEMQGEALTRKNDTAAFDPQDRVAPLFQREDYRSDKPRLEQVTRFACKNEIRY